MAVRRRSGTHTVRRIAASVLAGGLLAGGISAATPAAAGTPVVAIMQGSSTAAVEQVVGQFGGTVVTPLPIINGALVQMRNSGLVRAAQAHGLTATPDQTVAETGAPAALPASAAAASNAFPAETGATKLAENGITGTGVGVAVLDTGIDRLADFGNRLIGGVDYSGEGDPYQDNYGHGTFIAGLVAGDGTSSAGAYTGEATDANLIAIKVAGGSGVTDLAKVIQGISWAMSHKASLGIKVLNMSLGAPAVLPTQLNPLDQAVEAAWHAGITVVTSAGNAGPGQGTITSPGDDPYVVTVGGLNDAQTMSGSDDSIASFSSQGPTAQNAWLKPDLVAAGRSVVSLRAPGSYIDQNNPSASVGTANFVGSGTSFSTAVTSGAAALVAAQNPTAGPNEIKARLLATATAGPSGNPAAEGHGDLDAYDAANAPRITLSQPYGSVPIPSPLGSVIPLSSAWNASAWNGANYSVDPSSSAWNSSAWNASAWNSSAWNSSAWNSSAWNSSAWNSSAWNSSAWNSSAWNASAWNDGSWDAASWS
ncbi:MAG TPA: S8 family serine peptidase [Mycobacteriales bacterium]|nr:S8 family serine peptidase [Mycobacteriales bacterium]